MDKTALQELQSQIAAIELQAMRARDDSPRAAFQRACNMFATRCQDMAIACRAEALAVEKDALAKERKDRKAAKATANA